MTSTKAILALENGDIFHGTSIGVTGDTTGEIVFNTSMTGYQEILTDPSYAGQIVTLTHPHIGNVGANKADCESTKIWANGLIVRDASLATSNWRSEQSFADYLAAHNVVAIADIDTRQLTRLLRDTGSLRGCIMTADADRNLDEKLALEKARAFEGLNHKDLAKVVTTQQPYTWEEGTNHQKASNLKFHVVVYDYGVKHNILRLLVDQGCRLTVVPAQTPVDDVLALNPNGVLLSNGPGDPAACDYAITAIKHLLDQDMPLFGICLGYQLLALACEAKTVKMKFGHHGANHPVQDLKTQRVAITSQNHSFAVDEATLPDFLEPTHRSLFDQSLQGLRHKQKPAFGFQGHPEASPGPHDLATLFKTGFPFLADSRWV